MPTDTDDTQTRARGLIYERDALVRRDGVQHLATVPEDWEVKIVQLPRTPPFAVATYFGILPNLQPRIAPLDKLPLPFEQWSILGIDSDGA